MNRGMITPAARMKIADRIPRTRRMIQKRVAALLLLEELGEDGNEGCAQGSVGEEPAHQVGELEGDRERRGGAAGAEVARGEDLPREPRDPGEAGGYGEDRRVAGDARVGSRVLLRALSLDLLDLSPA
jgi:hypothetical protein